MSLVQRVTLRAGNNVYRHSQTPESPSTRNYSPQHLEPQPSSSSGWRISPIPWRMMLTESETEPEPGPSYRDDNTHAHYMSSGLKRQYDEENVGFQRKRFKSSPAPSPVDQDDIDRRISLAGIVVCTVSLIELLSNILIKLSPYSIQQLTYMQR